jgi:hypothetical protein
VTQTDIVNPRVWQRQKTQLLEPVKMGQPCAGNLPGVEAQPFQA